MDKTLEANGLPRVLIPIYEILQDYEKTITKIISDMREKQQKIMEMTERKTWRKDT